MEDIKMEDIETGDIKMEDIRMKDVISDDVRSEDLERMRINDRQRETNMDEEDIEREEKKAQLRFIESKRRARETMIQGRNTSLSQDREYAELYDSEPDLKEYLIQRLGQDFEVFGFIDSREKRHDFDIEENDTESNFDEFLARERADDRVKLAHMCTEAETIKYDRRRHMIIKEATDERIRKELISREHERKEYYERVLCIRRPILGEYIICFESLKWYIGRAYNTIKTDYNADEWDFFSFLDDRILIARLGMIYVTGLLMSCMSMIRTRFDELSKSMDHKEFLKTTISEMTRRTVSMEDYVKKAITKHRSDLLNKLDHLCLTLKIQLDHIPSNYDTIQVNKTIDNWSVMFFKDSHVTHRRINEI